MAKSLKNHQIYLTPFSLLQSWISLPWSSSRKNFWPTLALRHVTLSWTFPSNQYVSHYIETPLGEIKCNKSCGPDNIMPKILKFSAPAIPVHLTKLLNLCISTSMWPTEWKLEHVTPIFKKDDATSVSNYRPISVLSIISKILEKVMFDQLYDIFQPLFS